MHNFPKYQISHSKTKLLLLLLFKVLLFPVNLSGQSGQGDNWFFGNHAGIKFISGVPTVQTGGATDGTNNLEGTATISDSSSNLLFYTDGQRVWNKFHSIMSNTNMTGSMLHGHASSTQSGVIVPHPSSPDTYYIFTIDATQNYLNNSLKYSIVDMSLNSGSGGIPAATRNVLLTTSGVNFTEKVTAVRNCNNLYIWVIAHGYSVVSSTAGQKFYAYLLTPNGIITTPVVSTVGSVHEKGANSSYGNARGYMKASPDGRRIAVAVSYGDCTITSGLSPYYCGSTTGFFEVFDFDYTTGIVSNPIKISGHHKGAYGIEFSPNGNVLYGSTWASYGGDNKVYQWDLTAGSQSAINNSEVVVANESATTYGNFGALQLASNGKIYIARANKTYLSVIKCPNKLGTSCGYIQNGTSLGTGSGRYGLPTFVQSYFDPNLGYSYRDNYKDMITTFIIADSVRIDSVLWDFNDPTTGTSNTSKLFNPRHLFSDTGIYNVKLIVWRCNIVDTIIHSITIWPRPNASFTINDTAQCLGYNKFHFTNTSTISSGSIARYFWEFGDGDTSNLENPVHVYNSVGTFTVKLVATSAAGGMDSVYKQVKVISSPVANFIVNDTIQCIDGNIFYFINISSITPSANLSVFWDFANGDTAVTSFVFPVSYLTTDTFPVRLIVTSDSGCLDTAIQNLYVRPMPEADFIYNDSNQCLSGNNYLFTNQSSIPYDTLSFLWKFGDNDTSTSENPQHNYTSSGTYQIKLLTTSNHGCQDSVIKSITVDPMPNATFSVNDSTQCFAENIFNFSNSSSISSGNLNYLWLLATETLLL